MTTQQCLSRGQLKEYLSGWSDTESSAWIERHLAECGTCEQTVVALESEPDTLLELLPVGAEAENRVAHAIGRRAVASAGAGMDAMPAAPLDPSMGRALQASKQQVSDRQDPQGNAERSDPNAEGSAWPMLGRELAGYELLRPLGRGGMGTVYVARHNKLGKDVAIKLLPGEAFRDPRFAARFEREMRAAGGLDHAAIVRATDAGEVGGDHYLVMELIDGLDLSRIARLEGPLSAADTCAIGRQIALGLSHAHAAGIVHRDIKPSNLMLARDGQAKLLDFGLARTQLWDELSVELTTVGQLMGTIDYMAPEQAERPETVDYRADLYALGATLFRLLTGRTPLSISPNLSPLAKLRLLAMHEPPRLSTLRDDLPDELVQLVAELLSRNPESRPPSADHVAQRLCELGQGSDLPGLVALAVEHAADEADFVTQPSGSELASPAVLQTDSGDEPRALLGQPEHSLSRGGTHVGHRRWSWAGAMAGLLGLSAVAAGLVFAIETQKGQLVVESDVPGVTVQIKRGDSVAQELNIKTGPESTRLFAGQYEVVLSAGSDGVVIVGGNIQITRGQTTIARVQVIKNGGSAAASAATTDRLALPGESSPLMPGENLRIRSLSSSELNTTAAVLADSTVKLPIVGTVRLDGMTLDAFEQNLNQRYAAYIKNPMVEVFRESAPRPAWSDSTLAVPGAVIPPASSDKVQPGDALLISSIVDKDVACRVVVQADSTIKPTLVGTQSVAGMTVDQVQSVLGNQYAQFIKDPQIEVFRDFTAPRPAWAARGQQNPLLDALDTVPSDGAQGPAVDEPMYEARTLAQWLELLRRERSPSALGDVFTALNAMVNESNAARMTEAILAVVPQLRGSMQLVNSTPGGQGNRSLDSRAFPLLRRANPGKAYFDLIQTQLASTDSLQWKQRILQNGLLFFGEQVDALRSLNDYLLQNILLSNREDDLRASVIEAYRLHASDAQIEPAVGALLLGTLESLEYLDAEFWLEQFPAGRYTPLATDRSIHTTTLVWPAEWGKAVAKRAMLALEDPESSRSRVIQAERILAFLLICDQAEALAVQPRKIGKWVQQRLDSLTVEELLSTTEVPREFRGRYSPMANQVSLGEFRIRLSQTGEKSTDVETAALIELARAALDGDAFQQFLHELLARIEPVFFDLNFEVNRWSPALSSPRGRGFSGRDVSLTFPALADGRGEDSIGSPRAWLALILCAQVYDALDRDSRYAFKNRMEQAQQDRFFQPFTDALATLGVETVSLSEAEELMKSFALHPQLAEDLPNMCIAADNNGDGRLDIAELRELYQSMGGPRVVEAQAAGNASP